MFASPFRLDAGTQVLSTEPRAPAGLGEKAKCCWRN